MRYERNARVSRRCQIFGHKFSLRQRGSTSYDGFVEEEEMLHGTRRTPFVYCWRCQGYFPGRVKTGRVDVYLPNSR